MALSVNYAKNSGLWSVIRSGKVAVDIGQTYPLEEAEQAHRDAEARKTSGSTLLIP